jgi:outer membrane protein assembly factor BamB
MVLCVAALAAAAVAPRAASSADWPQLQRDAAHSGYTADQPGPPYRLLWWRDLKEPMATAGQPIVADGRLYVGTNYGNLYALDRRTGKTAWTHKTGGPILGSPAFAEGIVYANSMDHFCHAVNARTGGGVWTFETGEGIWAAPVVENGRVFVAGRDGFVYALDARSGKQLWRSPIGGLVMSTPACAEGRLYVAGGDMHVYAYDARSGRQVWKSPKVPGAAMREYWLVAAHGGVVLTTQLVYVCHQTQQLIQKAVMDPFNERTKNDAALKDEGTFPALVKWLETHPHHKTLLVLDAATGKEKFVAPIITVNGGSCIGPPPAVTPDGWAYTVYANIWLRASGWAFFGRLNLKDGRMEPLITNRYAPKLQHAKSWHWQPKKGHAFRRSSTWDGGFSVIDQSWGVSVGGDIAFPVRDPGWPGNPPFNNYYVISKRLDKYLLAGGRHRRLGTPNLGTLGGGQMHNTASPVAISGKHLFHKTSRSVIFAFEGK